MEEDHSYTYKMHVMAMNLMYRGGWVLFAYILIWNTFLLGDPCQVALPTMLGLHNILLGLSMQTLRRYGL